MKTLAFSSLACYAALMVTSTTADARHEIISPSVVPASADAAAQDSYTFVFDAGVPADLVHDFAGAIAENAGVHVIHIYSDSLRGFSARMSHDAAEKLASESPVIDYFEADGLSVSTTGGTVRAQQIP